MNPDDRLNEIFRQARQSPRPEPSDLGFETRLLAGIRAERQPGFLLGLFAWRLAPVFAAITLLVGIWDYRTTPETITPDSLGLDDRVLVDYLAAN